MSSDELVDEVVVVASWQTLSQLLQSALQRSSLQTHMLRESCKSRVAIWVLEHGDNFWVLE